MAVDIIKTNLLMSSRFFSQHILSSQKLNKVLACAWKNYFSATHLGGSEHKL